MGAAGSAVGGWVERLRRSHGPWMLSVLRRQNEKLEKELKDVRLDLNRLKREHAGCDAAISQKSDRIAELEKELEAARADALPPPEPPPPPATSPSPEPPAGPAAAEADEFRRKLNALTEELGSTSRKLSLVELRKSLLELQALTSRSEHDKEVEELKAKLQKARKDHNKEATELNSALAELRREAADLRQKESDSATIVEELLDAKTVIDELQKDVSRRDEQIEFLMQVHDASQDVEWVGKWPCAICTMLNPNTNSTCSTCGAPRARTPRPQGGGGEWSCLECTYVNEARSRECELCGEGRP
uniref:RanBP2-type domain-containing protein n=1 Tax=Alexandrium catenella TaxID=2925 RepID=A0A7S1SGA5_ALECA